MNLRTLVTAIIISLLVSGIQLPAVLPSAVASAQTSRSSRKKTAGKNGVRSGRKPAVKTAPAHGAKRRQETSADVRRQEEAARKEIALTKEQIRENDLAVKRGLNDLGKIQTDIEAGKKKLADATRQVRTVDNRINTLSSGIANGEKDLARLRAEYLKAVKKMRLKNKEVSDLAFIFASKNFNEALRRMRYLKQFAGWRDRQTAEIGNRVKQLKDQKALLARTRVEKQNAVKAEASAQASLQKQYSSQDAVVSRLKENGSALRSHLSNKQKEANALRGRISALIAEEQRRAEAERREREAREAEARRAEEQRLARIEQERRDREEQLRKEEQARKEELARNASGTAVEDKAVALAPEKPRTPVKAEKKKKTEKPAEKPGKPEKQKKQKEQKEKKNRNDKGRDIKIDRKNRKSDESFASASGSVSGKEYAEARRRAPRGGETPGAVSSANVPEPGTGKSRAAKATSNAAGNFESMRGSLPRPVSGYFKITSPFGPHSLPDLPDVRYDNPGIDAEVSPGASAQAVYAGKVSGVYVIPGYSTVVIVNHGNYYTVYGNIQTPNVKVGDSVKQGTNLGRLALAEEDSSHSSIHFEVWHNRDKQNPAAWIR